MAKSKSQKSEAEHVHQVNSGTTIATPQAFDATLSTLFAKSLGPVKPITRPNSKPSSLTSKPASSESIITSNQAETDEGSGSQSDSFNEQNTHLLSTPRKHKPTDIEAGTPNLHSRKRKRRGADDDVEGRYLTQLAEEDLKEDERREQITQNKRRKPVTVGRHIDEGSSSDAARDAESESTGIGNEHENDSDVAPQHETVVTPREDIDLEKSSRTVFLANVSTLAIKSKSAKKTLLDHLTSFTYELPNHNVKHGVESLRFRSIAFTSTGTPRKAAYVRKELMDTTTKSTNAYVVYTTQLAAREATRKLNGTMVLERHLRVDSVAHPAKIDHRRCVFVGNLGFVDDPSNMNAAEDAEDGERPRKARAPADVEEGLWRQFGKVGTVESVRVVRDRTTRVGKGFAYVQFENANAVENALLYNEKKFPPMLPRILRVTRAKDTKKASGRKDKRTVPKQTGELAATYKPKIPSQVQSLTGRAGKLFGRAGAAQLKVAGRREAPQSKGINSIAKSPETIIFEGYRASRQQGKGVMRTGQSGTKRGKPSARSKGFKAKGRKKG